MYKLISYGNLIKDLKHLDMVLFRAQTVWNSSTILPSDLKAHLTDVIQFIQIEAKTFTPLEHAISTHIAQWMFTKYLLLEASLELDPDELEPLGDPVLKSPIISSSRALSDPPSSPSISLSRVAETWLSLWRPRSYAKLQGEFKTSLSIPADVKEHLHLMIKSNPSIENEKLVTILAIVFGIPNPPSILVQIDRRLSPSSASLSADAINMEAEDTDDAASTDSSSSSSSSDDSSTDTSSSSNTSSSSSSDPSDSEDLPPRLASAAGKPSTHIDLSSADLPKRSDAIKLQVQLGIPIEEIKDVPDSDIIDLLLFSAFIGAFDGHSDNVRMYSEKPVLLTPSLESIPDILENKQPLLMGSLYKRPVLIDCKDILALSSGGLRIEDGSLRAAFNTILLQHKAANNEIEDSVKIEFIEKAETSLAILSHLSGSDELITRLAQRLDALKKSAPIAKTYYDWVCLSYPLLAPILNAVSSAAKSNSYAILNMPISTIFMWLERTEHKERRRDILIQMGKSILQEDALNTFKTKVDSIDFSSSDELNRLLIDSFFPELTA